MTKMEAFNSTYAHSRRGHKQDDNLCSDITGIQQAQYIIYIVSLIEPR